MKKLKWIIIIILIVLFITGGLGTLTYFKIIDIPIFNELLNKIGILDDDEEISYEDYKFETIDADKYFESNSQILEKIKVNESQTILTEADTIKLLNGRGFKDYPITTQYNMEGIYNNAITISESSSDKHPTYETYYVNTSNELWSIVIIHNVIMAIPISYNEQSTRDALLILSESDNLTSYDSVTNTFYKTIPKESAQIVKTVEKINAVTLDKMTIEVIDTL